MRFSVFVLGLWASSGFGVDYGADDYLAKLNISIRPIRFQGPELVLKEGLSDRLIKNLRQESLLLDPTGQTSLVQKKFAFRLEGEIRNGDALFIDGVRAPLVNSRWVSDRVLQPGTNRLSVVIKSEDGRSSEYHVDIQLLNFRRPDEPFPSIHAPPESFNRREGGWVVSLGASSGAYDFDIVSIPGSPAVVDQLKDDIVTVDASLESFIRYWIPTDHWFFKDIAFQVYGQYLFPIGAALTLMHFRAGPLWRFYFEDHILSPLMTVQVGGMYYSFDYLLVLSNNSTSVSDYGFYGQLDGELPITEAFSLLGGLTYGLYLPSTGSGMLLEVGGGFLVDLSRDLRLGFRAAYRDHGLVDGATGASLHHKFVSLISELRWDI